MTKSATRLIIELPERERGVDDGQLRRLDKLLRQLRQPGLSPDDRAALARKLKLLEAEVRGRGDADRMRDAQAETVALAQARGDEIATTKGGAKLIITNDGLWNLHERRKLTIEQYEEGNAYRKDRERRLAGLGSQLGAMGGGSGHNNDLYVLNCRLRAEASSMVAIIERAVAMYCSPNSLAMLRSVAGDGKSITVWGKGRALDRNVADLATALDVAAIARAGENKRRKSAA